MQMNPFEHIVPLFGVSESSPAIAFLGTGTFAAQDHLLVTADHVIRDWTGPLAILLQAGNERHRAEVVHRDEPHDIALLRVATYRAPRPIPVAVDRPYHLNQFVIAFDYGTTTPTPQGFHLSPATRIGNVTRIRDMQSQFGPGGESMLELSFPALRGASGGPVLSNDEHMALLGIVVANVSHHLLPAQIESVLDEKNQIYEETRFMLPQGLAVNSRHVARVIDAARAKEKAGAAA